MATEKPPEFSSLREAKKHFAAVSVPRLPRTVYFCLLDHRHFHKKCGPGCTIPEGKCCPSRSLIAELTGYSVRSVTDAIRWLVDHAYLEVWVLGEGHDDMAKSKHKYFFVLIGWGESYVPTGAHKANLAKSATRKHTPKHLKKLHSPQCSSCTHPSAEIAPTTVQNLHINSDLNSASESEVESGPAPSTPDQNKKQKAAPAKDEHGIEDGAAIAPSALYEEVTEVDDLSAPLVLHIKDWEELHPEEVAHG